MISSQNRPRYNGFNPEKFRFWKEMGRNSFYIKVIDEWKGLNNPIVSAQSIGSFKRRLDKFMV